MSYTIAPSVRAALAQASSLWPGRSTASDGTIGDARHQAEAGGSDHNPDAHGIVHAFDLTHDPAHGVDCNVLAAELAKRIARGAEFRVKYLIWNRRIFNPSISMMWRPYSGTDPHTNHLHCSILSGTGAENDTSAWWTPAAGLQPPPPVAPPTPPAAPPTIYHFTLNGVPMAGQILDIPLDGDGIGVAPICPEGKLVSCAPYAEHARYAGDADTIVWQVAPHLYDGTWYAAAKGGDPHGTAHAWVTVAD